MFRFTPNLHRNSIFTVGVIFTVGLLAAALIPTGTAFASQCWVYAGLDAINPQPWVTSNISGACAPNNSLHVSGSTDGQTIGERHRNWHCANPQAQTEAYGRAFLAFHRQFILDFDIWRLGLPGGWLDRIEIWDPKNLAPVPGDNETDKTEFTNCSTGAVRPAGNTSDDNNFDGVPDGLCQGCSDLPDSFSGANLNDFSSLGEVGWNLEYGWHGSYHGGVSQMGCTDIGGFLYTARDPAFWMAHKKLDEVARDWQSLQATDVVLVIDRSGSMDDNCSPTEEWPCAINDVREAAREFADLVLDVRLTTTDPPVPAAEQHRIGLVSFNHGAAQLLYSLTSADGIVTKNGVDDTPFETALAGISAGGATSIAAGIREAISMLNSESDPNPHQAILVLTDGKENWAPCLAGNSPSDCIPNPTEPTDVLTVGEVGDIQIVAIGFGEGAEEANLRDVAERHGGVFFAAPNISKPLTLQKFFVSAFCEIFDAACVGAPSSSSPKSLLASALDPTGTMQSGQQASEPFKIEIASGDERLTVVLGFEEIRRDSSECDLELELFTPSGKRVNRPDQGIEASQGPRYDFITANLPYQGESTGTWTGLVGRPPGSERDCGAQDYFYSVLVKGLGRIDPFVVRPNLVVGRTILATFRISESNRPVGGFDRVDAEVTLTRPDGRTETHPLFDDGTNGDRLAGNHIWSVEIPDPVKEPGPYHLRAHFELTHREGTRARLSEYSIIAQPLPEHCTNVVASGIVNAYMQHRPQPGDIIHLNELVCLSDKCGAPDRYEMQISDSMGWLRTPDPQGTGALIDLPRSFRSGSVKGFGKHCLGSPDPDDSDGGIPLVAVIPESARPGDRSVVSIRVKSLTHPDQEPVDVETAIEVFPPPDCNQNGVGDAIDIANGTSKDQDHNGIPDECAYEDHHNQSEAGYGPPAAAPPYIHVSVADVAERPGNLVEVPILVSDATGLAGGDLVLTYDAEVLTPRRVRTGDLLTSAGIITVVNLQLRGEVRVSMAGATAIRAGAETESNAGDLVGIDIGPVFMEALVTAVFEVHPNAPEGTTPLALQAALKDEKGAAIPFTVQHGSVTVVVGLLGDVNNDQRVDAGDAILVLRHAVRLSTLTREQQKLGDVNKDGKVDAGDAILILRFDVGLIEVFKPLATQPIIEPIIVRLADVQRSFDGTLSLTFVLDPVEGAVGGDLLLAYPPTMGRPMDIQLEGLPEEAFFAVNTHTAGQVRVSFAHGDGSLQASQIALHMLLPDAQPSQQLEIGLTGQLYNLRGQPVGEVRLERTTVQVLPSQYALLQNYPNPFNPVTAIRYNLPQRGHVVLTIYSMTGQLVRTLVDDQVEAGHHTIEWDGKNSRGQQVSSGICLYRLVVDGGQYTALRRMVLLK